METESFRTAKEPKSTSILQESLNPIAYGILRLSQLRGGDFYPTPQKTMLKLFDWFEIWYTVHVPNFGGLSGSEDRGWG